MTLEHRLQILLDDDRHRRISAAARERGVSVATIVREAIDRGVVLSADGRRSAGQRILAAPGMEVPDVDALVRELDDLRGPASRVIVLDTTVLVYALGSDHPLREPCRALIAAIAAGKVDATTSVEVVQEFVHVRSRRHGRTEAASLGRDYAELLAPLLAVSEADLEAGLTLFRDSQSLGAFDAVLAAAALSADAALVSADRAFATVAGLRHSAPDAVGVATLLEE